MVSWSLKGRIERARPRGRYGDVYEVKDCGEAVGWVGRDAYLDTAYFEFKGSRTPETAGAIRKHWAQKHQVSRVDACEDYDAEDALQRLVDLVDRCKDPRVKAKAIVPRGSDDGATYYWGGAVLSGDGAGVRGREDEGTASLRPAALGSCRGTGAARQVHREASGGADLSVGCLGLCGVVPACC